MAGPGGFGQEQYGDPMGGGGPLSVLQARAVTSHTVRVAFSVEPVHLSPAGSDDALNPANYTFGVVTGDATPPLPVGVSADLLEGPVYGVPSGAWGVDVHTDRMLVSGITYSVTARDVGARGGGTLGAPYTANFVGVALVRTKDLPPRKVELTDIANDPFGGRFSVDDSGDLGLDDAARSLRKRLLRRATTPVNAFAHLPGYGCGIRLKKNFSPAQLAATRTDLRNQCLQEPEVVDVAVEVTQLGVPNVVQFVIRAKTRTGAVVSAGGSLQPGGVFVPS